MIKFIPTLPDDLVQITEWIEKDPYHLNHDPQWWLTGEGYLSFCIQDGIGPVIYVRIEEEGDLHRLHCQFGPPEEVSKRRVAAALMQALPAVIRQAQQKGAKGLIFNSVSPVLIKFLSSWSFLPVENDDYVVKF